MPSTTQAAVRAALKTALVAHVGLAGVNIGYGQPTGTFPSECIWIGNAYSNAPHEAASFRKGHRKEDYTIEVNVQVANKTTPELSEARTVALCDEVIEVVVAASTFGVAGVVGIYDGGMSLQTMLSEQGTPLTEAKISVNVKARLTT